MDSISGDSANNVIHQSLNDTKVGSNISSSSVAFDKTVPNSSVELNALSDLTNRANGSSSDIREDVIAKARGLLEDPDWLSDSNLMKLSEKILNTEDFDS